MQKRCRTDETESGCATDWTNASFSRMRRPSSLHHDLLRTRHARSLSLNSIYHSSGLCLSLWVIKCVIGRPEPLRTTPEHTTRARAQYVPTRIGDYGPAQQQDTRQQRERTHTGASNDVAQAASSRAMLRARSLCSQSSPMTPSRYADRPAALSALDDTPSVLRSNATCVAPPPQPIQAPSARSRTGLSALDLSHAKSTHDGRTRHAH
jgi:hypothetical protein